MYFRFLKHYIMIFLKYMYMFSWFHYFHIMIYTDKHVEPIIYFFYYKVETWSNGAFYVVLIANGHDYTLWIIAIRDV